MAFLPSPDLTPQIGVGDYSFKVENHPAFFRAAEDVKNYAHSNLRPACPGTAPQRGNTSSSHRTPQACDRCKSRKLKCDSLLNSCENCRAAGELCYQTNKMTKRREQRGHWEELTESNEFLRSENARLQKEIEHLSQDNAQLVDQLKVMEYITRDLNAMTPEGLPAFPTIHDGCCVPASADPASNSMTLFPCQVPGHTIPEMGQYSSNIDTPAPPYQLFSTGSPSEEESGPHGLETLF